MKRPEPQTPHDIRRRHTARTNGQLVLFLLVPLVALSPLLASDGQPWHWWIAMPVAAAVAAVACWSIRWSSRLD